MKRLVYISLYMMSVMLTSCSTGGADIDSAETDTAVTADAEAIAETPATLATGEREAAPPPSPAVPAPAVPPAQEYAHAYPVAGSAPAQVLPGMKVSDALRVPGASQTVSAIMTGGKITGTVVIQWDGKSWYTNVDFAEEGGFANGTRYTTPEDVQAFIEVACSDGAVPADFTETAIVTEQIR